MRKTSQDGCRPTGNIIFSLAAADLSGLQYMAVKVEVVYIEYYAAILAACTVRFGEPLGNFCDFSIELPFRKKLANMQAL